MRNFQVIVVLACLATVRAQATGDLQGVGSVVKLIPLGYIQLYGKILNANQGSRLGLVGFRSKPPLNTYVFSINDERFVGITFDTTARSDSSVRSYVYGDSLGNVLAGLGLSVGELQTTGDLSKNYAMDFLQNHPLTINSGSTYFSTQQIPQQISFAVTPSNQAVLTNPVNIRSSYSNTLIQGLNTVPNVYTNPSVVSMQDRVNYYYDPTTSSLIQTRNVGGRVVGTGTAPTPATGPTIIGRQIAPGATGFTGGNVVGTYNTGGQLILTGLPGSTAVPRPQTGTVFSNIITAGSQPTTAFFQPGRIGTIPTGFTTTSPQFRIIPISGGIQQNLVSVPQTFTVQPQPTAPLQPAPTAPTISTQTTSTDTSNLEILSKIPPAALDRLQAEFPNFSRVDIANTLAKDPTALNAINFYAMQGGSSSSTTSTSTVTSGTMPSLIPATPPTAPSTSSGGSAVSGGSSQQSTTTTTTTIISGGTTPVTDMSALSGLLTPQTSLSAPETLGSASFAGGIQGTVAPQGGNNSTATSTQSSTSSSTTVASSTTSSQGGSSSGRSDSGSGRSSFFYPDISNLAVHDSK